MTKDEALKQALEVIEAIHTVGDVACVVTPNGTIYLQPAITTIKEALDECDADAIIIQYHEATIKWLEKRIEELTAQPEQEPVARVIDDGTPEGATEWIPFTNRVEPLKTGDLLYTTPPAAPPPVQPEPWCMKMNGCKTKCEDCPDKPPEERNFCQRCGKRTADLTTIHTCTPPQSQWVNLTVDELIDLERKHLSHENLTRAIEAKLKEKNT